MITDKFEFCSVLKDHPDVSKQAQLYPYINVNYDKSKIPETFDGRYIWSMYIEPPSIQRDSSSWGLVAKDILNDRYCLSTAGQLYFFLDYTEMTACMDKPPLKKLENVPSTNSLILASNLTQGYSIYDAWEYIYSYGLSNWNCVSREAIVNIGMTPPDKINYEKGTNYYKDYCKKTLSACTSVDSEGKHKARRAFFCDSIFNIEGRNMSERIMNIKWQIAKWGPVAGGFLVYENFMNSYKGLDVYSKAEGKVLGGHYVSIIGWGKDYWICRNSFGSNWGLMGYFYMKMGLEDCKLEYNVSAVSPSILSNPKYERRLLVPDGMTYNGRKVYLDNMDLFNIKIYNIRKDQQVNYELFYTQQTIDLIKSGKLYGQLKPLIRYLDLLPDMNFFWLKDMTKYDYVNLDGKIFYDDINIDRDNRYNYAQYGIVLGIVFFIIAYIKYK